MLTRRQSLALLGASAFSPFCCTFHSHAEPLKYDLKPLALAPGVWVVPGAQAVIGADNGGAIANLAILDTAAGAVVIDTGPSRRFGEALHALAKNLTGKDVARVYITHFHPDHMFGNQGFDPAVISATQKTRDGIEQLGNAFSDSMYRTVGDWMRGTDVVLPEKILEADNEDFGDRRLRLFALRGHTPSDLAIFDEASGILFAGDLTFLDRAPTTPHADLANWHASLGKLKDLSKAILVPGHGPVESTDRAIAQTTRWLEAIETIIRDAFNRGLDVTEAIALPLPDWTSGIALARYEFTRSVMHLYPKLEAGEWPRVDLKG